jgi:hypothetical protein
MHNIEGNPKINSRLPPNGCNYSRIVLSESIIEKVTSSYLYFLFSGQRVQWDLTYSHHLSERHVGHITELDERLQNRTEKIIRASKITEQEDSIVTDTSAFLYRIHLKGEQYTKDALCVIFDIFSWEWGFRPTIASVEDY